MSGFMGRCNPMIRQQSVSSARKQTWPIRIALFLAAVVIAAGGWYFVRTRERWEQREAVLRLEREHRPEAANALRDYLKKYPDDTEVLTALIAILIRSNDPPPEIEPYLNRLCDLRPNEPTPYRSRAQQRFKLGAYPGVLADARRVLELDPNDHDTRLLGVHAAINLADYEFAKRELAVLLQRSSHSKKLLGTLLARSYLERGDVVQAGDTLNRFVHPEEDFPPGQMIRGLIHFEAGQYEQAEKVLRAVAPKAGQERPRVLYHLALALESLGRTDESQKVFAQLDVEQTASRARLDASHRLDDMQLQIRAAQINLDAGLPEHAVELLERALARLGPDPQALRTLADSYDKLGRSDLATAARRRADKPVEK
jgi:tetratricopeptide (TPR) repeat protein